MSGPNLRQQPSRNGAAAAESAVVEYLRGRDVPCPRCRYNLRDLASDRCPECGHHLRLALERAETPQTAWTVAAAAACASGGAGLFILCVTTREGSTWQSLLSIKSSLLYFVAMVPAAVLLLCLRRAFLDASRVTQWVIAAAAVGLTVAGFAAFLAGLG